MQYNVHPEQKLVIEDLKALAQSCGFNANNLRLNCSRQIHVRDLIAMAHNVHCACPPPNFPASLIDRLASTIDVREKKNHYARRGARYRQESSRSHENFTLQLVRMRDSLVAAHPSYWKRMYF